MNENDKVNVNPKSESDNIRPIYVAHMPGQEAADDEINLLDYWRVLVNFKWLIFAIVVLTTSASVAAALLMTPIYRAEVLAAPVEDDKGGGLGALAGQFGGLASLAGISLGGGSSKVGEAIAILQSRSFTEGFVKDYQLMPILFADVWDSNSKQWKVNSEEDIPSMWDAYKKISDSIFTVSEDKKSGMVTLAVEWTDPELAARWANILVWRINQYMKTSAIDEAEKSIAYLKQQAESTSVVEMRQAIYRLIEAQTKNIMLANVRDEFVFNVIDPAVVPEEKVKPKRKLIVVLGAMVGLMLGVFLAFFISFVRKQKQESQSTANTA